MQFPFELPSGRDFDVVGFGTNAVDFLIQVPEYPPFNSKIELSQYTQAAGGEVASAMAGLHRLGCRTSYIGRFGSDEAGRFGMRALRDEGVDLTYAETIEGARTQIAFIVIDERNGERTVIWKRDQRLAYSPDEAPIEAIGRTRVLHFTPHDTAACIRLAREAKDRGVIVSIDIDNVFDGIDVLLPLVDVLIASAEFPRKFLGAGSDRDGLAALHKRFASPIVGITLGEQGSILLSGGNLIETPAFPVPGGCKDTTGAGDAFRVGFIYGMLQGESIEESARMANAVASLKCRRIGARTALPAHDELSALLKI
jgi:sugar/nucleoside kinase (ribokinase family)